MAVDWLPEPGETLDERYELGEQIGVGPTGAVYAATRLQDGKQIVLKIFHPELFAGQVRGPNTMRLQRARLMRAPGLITLEEVDVREGSAFVVMPHIHSPTLLDLIDSQGSPDLSRVIELTQAVGQTLATIHQLGVHGDVKPSNIYVNSEGDVLLSDPWFLEGLAGIRDAAGLAPRADAWLAPEQSAGTWQERPETDIYRLAMLMGWLLHGEVVQGGRSLIEQGVSAPEGLDAVFMRATEMDPGERFGQVQGFLDALSNADVSEGGGLEELEDATENQPMVLEPVEPTAASGEQSALDMDETMTQGAQILKDYGPISLEEGPADETLEDANPQASHEDHSTGGEDEPEQDPAATRVLRADTPEQDASVQETFQDETTDDQADDSEERSSAEAPAPDALPAEVEEAADGGIGQSLDSLTNEEEFDGEEQGEPQRYETIRDVPGAVADLNVSAHPESTLEADDLKGQGLTSTRKQIAPELDPNWRTNPIMLIGPILLVLSLFVALSVLDNVQDRRHVAAAMASTAVETSKKAVAPTPQEPSPVVKGASPGEPTAPVPEDKAKSTGEGGAPSTPTAVAPPEPSKTETAPAEPAKADEAPPASGEATDYRALKCPANMIRVRRTKKSRDGGDAGQVDVWCIDRYEFPGKNRTPRAGIGVVKAERLCAERGHRLCTRREWSVACGGGGKYPYKGEFDPDACNSAAPGPTPRSVKPSGSKLRCVSGWGAYDMVGNVAEWTSEGKVNGGSATSDAEGGTCYRSIPRKSGGSDVGFRCCAEPSSTELSK